MKTILFFLLISTFSYSQMAIYYGKPMKNGNYTIYKAKDGTTVKTGDTLHINPPAGNQYSYIGQLNMPAGTILANKDVVISKIKVYGTKGHKPNVLIGFKGYGLATLYMDYENAIEVGEVYNPNGVINKKEALTILKEKKELLDLQLITQEEYNQFKKDLAPIIMN